MKPIAVRSEVDEKIIEAARFYESRSEGLGFEFLEEVERSLDQIVAMPEAWQKIGDRVRRKPMWRFPFNVIYAVYADGGIGPSETTPVLLAKTSGGPRGRCDLSMNRMQPYSLGPSAPCGIHRKSHLFVPRRSPSVPFQT